MAGSAQCSMMKFNQLRINASHHHMLEVQRRGGTTRRDEHGLDEDIHAHLFM